MARNVEGTKKSLTGEEINDRTWSKTDPLYNPLCGVVKRVALFGFIKLILVIDAFLFV